MALEADGRPRIRLEHGSGGALSRELIETVVYPRLASVSYASLSDATEFVGQPAMVLTTDSYVVDPPFFPGGDIGSLCVYGTCNDLAVSGGRPRYLSLALVLEEGYPIADLEAVLDSIVSCCAEAGVSVISGDTKVVPAGKGGGIYVNTSGVGEKLFAGKLDGSAVGVGDVVILSGPIGSHGLAVLAAREGLKVAGTLRSDCGSLYPACSALYPLGDGLKFMRDATRGGLAAVLNEAASSGGYGILVEEPALPVEPDVLSAANLLGLSPAEIANEGVFVAVVAADVAEQSLKALGRVPISHKACVIGEVTEENPGRVILHTRVGGHRILDVPRGLLLPRIC